MVSFHGFSVTDDLVWGDESVFAFSSNPESHAIILQHYGNFADVYVT